MPLPVSDKLKAAIAPYAGRSYLAASLGNGGMNGEPFDAATALNQMVNLNDVYHLGLTEDQMISGIKAAGDAQVSNFGQIYEATTPAAPIATQALRAALGWDSPKGVAFGSLPEIKKIQADGIPLSVATFNRIHDENSRVLDAWNREHNGGSAFGDFFLDYLAPAIVLGGGAYGLSSLGALGANAAGAIGGDALAGGIGGAAGDLGGIASTLSGAEAATAGLGTGSTALGSTLESALTGGAGTGALGGGTLGDTLGGLANPLTAPEIPEVYQTVPGASSGSGLSLSDLTNLPNPTGLGGNPTTAQGGTDEFGNQINNTGGTSATATDIANQTASSAGGSTTANAAQQAAWQKVLNGTAGPEDWVKLGSQVLPGLIGAYQSNQQTNALQGIADQARNDRLPFLNASKGYLSDPASFYSGPQATGSLDAILRKLSVGGNVSDPAKLGIANTSLNQNYWNTVGQLGQLGLSGNVPALQTNAVTQSGQTGANIGSAVSNVFNPQQTLAELLKQFGGGVNLNTGSVPV